MQHAAERVEVAQRCDLRAVDLLGWHVTAGTDPAIGGREPGDIRAHQLCDAEVQHLDRAVSGDQDVVRLQIAVHDRDGVRVRQDRADLRRDRRGPAHREQGRRFVLRACEYLAQGDSAHVLYDQVQPVVRRLLQHRVEHLRCPVVPDPSGDAGLAFEAAGELLCLRGRCDDVGPDELDCDLPVQDGVVAPPDRAHTAGLDLLDQLIVALLADSPCLRHALPPRHPDATSVDRCTRCLFAGHPAGVTAGGRPCRP